MSLIIEIILTYRAFPEANRLWELVGFSEQLATHEKLVHLVDDFSGRKVKLGNVSKYIPKTKDGSRFKLSPDNLSAEEDNYISLSNPAESNLGRFDIINFEKLIEHREDWLPSVINHDSFVQARIANTKYDTIQNMNASEWFEIKGIDHSHMPKKNNGKPGPLNMDEIDISVNPGRWYFKNGYLESIGSEMWLGKHFFQRANLDPVHVLNCDWLEVKQLENDVLHIKAYDQPFDSSEGEQKIVQDKLRDLLFKNQPPY